MPTLVIKSTISCCTSRNPPSPDGPATRPASQQFEQSKTALKDPVPTWTTVEAREFQAIFKKGISQTPSINQEGQTTGARYRAILTGDDVLASDDEDYEVEHVKSKRSSISLKAVTEKLKKHLSKESNLSKRHSRSSVGTTEEEVERRAELRRIRQKRIQEELSSEGIYDEDAKSLSSIPGSGTPSRRKSFIPHSRRSSVPVIEEDVSKESNEPLPPVLEQPNNTQRKLSTAQETSIQRAFIHFNQVQSIDNVILSTGNLSRRHSLPTMHSSGATTPDSERFPRSRRQSSLPSIPDQPVLLPTRLPSITDDMLRSSWRLSFSCSENRGKLLRKLSSVKVPPKPNLPQFEVNDRPMKWLHSQGLRSTSQALSFSEKSVKPEPQDPPPRTRSPSRDYGGIDGSGDDTPPVHLHEMGISQRLARGLQSTTSTSSPELSNGGSHDRGSSSQSNDFQDARDDRSRYMRSTSESLALSERLPRSWGKAIDDTSSFYPSVDNSIQPSPEVSHFNLASILSDRNGQDPSKREEPHIFEPLPNLSIISTRNLSSASLTIPLTKYPRHPTNDDSSLLISETDSYRAREAELSIIPTRFVSSETRRAPGTPVSSKFGEEFEFDPPLQPTQQNRKTSTFARFAKFASRSYDGEMEDVLNVPMPNFDASKLKREEDTGIWGAAKKKGGKDRKKSEDDVKGAFGSLKFGKGKKKDDKKFNAGEEYQKRFQERVAVKELVMDDWEAEMAATAKKAQAKSRNIVKKSKPAGPDHRYPASWSKFPSHTRHERSLSAKDTEGVQKQDFAILGKDDNGEDIWCLAHDDDGHHTFLDYLHRKKKLRERVEANIEDALYHLDTEHGSASEIKGRRSSLNPAGDLDYPELEILAGTGLTRDEPEESLKHHELELEKMRKMLAAKVGVDGNEDATTDTEASSTIDNNALNIADPKFYEECVVHVTTAEQETDEVEELSPPQTTSKKDKFRTWSGKDRNWDGRGQKLQKRSRHSLGTMVLRESTHDNCLEMEKMEEVERRRVLSTAEQAWGRRK